MLLFLACGPGPDSSPPLNLSAALGPDEVRAGIVLETDALFDGIAAEGRLGDIKIYNDRARFIIQQPGDSSYYVEYGGMLIDADIVRPAGELGRDAIDELGPMIGLGRIVNAENVTVMDDGQAGEAWVRVEGPTQALQIMTGSLENPDLVPDLDLWVCTDYRLKAGSPLLEVTTTVKNREATAQDLFIGDIGFLSMEAVERYRPRTGLDNDGEPVPWEGVIGRADEGALALLSQEGDLEQGMVGSLLSALGPVISGFGPTTTVAAGESLSFQRYIGVAPDLATLSAEQLRLQGQSLQTLSGHVQSDVGPVAGARVHLLDAQNQPLTLTFTDEAGDWSATVPQEVSTWRVSGVGDPVWVDLPAGHGWYGAYAADHGPSLASFSAGGPAHPFARGFGLSEATSASSSSLSAPGQVSVQVQDGLPAVLRIDPLDAVIPLDRRFVSHDDRAIWGLIRDGNLDVSLPAGQYRLVVYRGVQDELYAENITVISGAQTTVSATILPAYRAEGWVTGDPHTHASPSGDGEISMEDRLIAMAANGIDVHFGTDHDHVVDYRPLLAPLGLDRVLSSVVADEVSPVLRGHFNAWPLESLPKANGGAWRWWQGYEDTTDIFNHIRAMLSDGVISSNHPIGKSGMMSFAKFSPQSGEVAVPDHWSSDFDAMEVVNSGDYLDYFEAYLSLINRGLIVTPFGVSDSHGYSSGGLGLNLTFFHTDDQLSPEALVDAVRRQATVASHGPFIDARIHDTSAPGTLVSTDTSLEVTVYAPSWMPVDTVSLYENGVVISALPCEGIAPTPCTAQWTLAPAQDAAYVVTASSSLPMIDAHPGELAWAMTAAIRVDVGGDGWSSPLPALFP